MQLLVLANLYDPPPSMTELKRRIDADLAKWRAQAQRQQKAQQE